MIELSKQKKRCHTVSAWTLYKEKILLVKHKKLGIWLAPGGHVEENELPHQAAEREFFEETGVQATALSAFSSSVFAKDSHYLPLPFFCHVHDINKPREGSFCQEHYSWGFFVHVIDDSGFGMNDDESTDISWFTRDEVMSLETAPAIIKEALFVFDNFPTTHSFLS